MKCLVLFNNKNWFERISVKFSESEKEILQNEKTEEECKTNIWKNFRERSFKTAEASDSAVAQSILDSYMIENPEAEIIVANVILPSKHGQINLKIKNEYKIIRF